MGGSKKTTTKINQTTTPSVTEPYNTAFSDFTGQIGDFLAMDPTQFVAPPSQLQTQAFSDAQNLGGWQDYLNQATSYANQYASHPATQVTATGYQAPTVPDPYQFGGAQLGQAATYGGTTLGPASTYGGAQLGPAAQMTATGYQAPTINGVAGPQAYGAQQTNVGQAPTVNLGGYNLPQLGDASQVGNFGYNAALASAQGLLGDPSRIKDFMADYQNPYTQQVIDASTAKFDEDAGRRQAELAAQGAIGGAFGGSRFGIAEGTLQGSLARERADLQARLLDEQYKTAAGLAGSDASAFNQFGLVRGQMGLQTALANQASQNQAGQFNASSALQSALANQQANNQFGLTRYGAGIDQARYGADASNQGQLANQNMLAQFAMAQFGADTQSAQQFASALNQASLAGYQGDLQTALTQAGMDADQARYYADAMNQAGITNMNALNQFTLQQGNLTQQAGLANQDAINNFMLQQGLLDQQTGQMNMDALNQFALQQGLLDQQTGQFNTQALNQFLQTQVGLDADAAKYYADALNQASFTNANLTEQDYLRELQAAGLLGDLGQQYGQQSLADLGMTADLGTLQRSLEEAYLNAYPTQLQLAGNLYSQISPSIYTGSTTIGKNTTKESGGLLNQVVGSALQAAPVLFSDRRLKSNIVKIGKLGNGLGVYEYDIFGRRERGVMADEVARVVPEALGPIINGYATVNYGEL